MKLRLSYGRLILVALFLLLPVRAPAAQTAESSSIGWAGLWNNEMVEWAENANRVYKLCPKSMSQDLYEKCRKNHLAKKTWIIQAYKGPGNRSEKVGEILVTVKPGSSFIALKITKERLGTLSRIYTIRTGDMGLFSIKPS